MALLASTTPFARLSLQLRQRWMLEAGEEIVGKLALQTAMATTAGIQDDEIRVTDICVSVRLSNNIQNRPMSYQNPL
jgi:hypothetical protein